MTDTSHTPGASKPPIAIERPALFALGQIVATPAAMQLLDRAGVAFQTLVERHVTGDFGQLDAEDVQTNHAAIHHGLRILSAYVIAGQRLYVISEADRTSTCLLLAGEY